MYQHKNMKAPKVASTKFPTFFKSTYLTFFLVPTYWEFKYRNITEYPDLISFEERNKDYERSDLQKFWPSYLSIASMIPNVLFLKLNAIFGHRFRSQPRLLTAMIIIIGEFEILIQYHFLIFF